MAEAPRPAVAGKVDPDHRNPRGLRVLFGFRATAVGTSRHHPHTHRGAPLRRLAEAVCPAVAGAAVAGAPLLPCSLPELARPKVAGVAHLAGKRKRRRSKPDRSRRRSRPESSPVARSIFGQEKSTDRVGGVDPSATVPHQQISKNGNFPK